MRCDAVDFAREEGVARILLGHHLRVDGGAQGAAGGREMRAALIAVCAALLGSHAAEDGAELTAEEAPTLEDFEAELARIRAEDTEAVSVVPKDPNWDLKRDIEPKLAILRKRTPRAGAQRSHTTTH